MRSALRDAAAAFGFLTVVPVGRMWDEGEAPNALPWYPAVGWFLGLCAVGSVLVADVFGLAVQSASMLTGALVVGGWGVLTRFMHWDGLADAADGLLGSMDAERRLEIMQDSSVGAFATIVVVLVAVIQVTAVAEVVAVGTYWPLIAAPVVARAAATLAAWRIPPARTEGLGLSVAPEKVPLGSRSIAALSVLLLAGPIAAEFALGPGPWQGFEVGVVLVIADVAALGVPRLLARPVGGTTGDLHGATIVLVEAAILAAAALVV